jgi:hypothetical protein
MGLCFPPCRGKAYTQEEKKRGCYDAQFLLPNSPVLLSPASTSGRSEEVVRSQECCDSFQKKENPRSVKIGSS